jgi:Zn-dependent metalloprotease
MVWEGDSTSKKSLSHKANRNKAAKMIQERRISADPQQAEEVQKFVKRRPNIEVMWNSNTGFLRALGGEISDPELPGLAEMTFQAAGDYFLLRNSSVFGVEKDLKNFSRTDQFSLDTLEAVRYQQTIQGFKVYGAGLTLCLDNMRKVRIVVADTIIHSDIKSEDKVRSLKEAKDVAINDLGKDIVLRDGIVNETVFYPSEKEYVKSYHLTIPSDEPLGDWDYFIDASSLDILDSFNSLRFATTNILFGPRGKVFMENPDKSTVLDNVILRDVNHPYLSLDGKNVRVLNDDGPEATTTAANGYKFYFPENDTHFDEVQLYYAMERTTEYLFRLGFRGFTRLGRNGVLTGNVHVGTNFDNAFYSPATGQVSFGDGSYPSPGGFKDLSKEIDVVTHEMGHAVIDEYAPGISGADAFAYHEGQADYFACSMTNDHFLGEYVTPGAGSLRDTINNEKYPGAGGPHSRGRIWSGACWNLRTKLNEYVQYNELGYFIADFLIFYGLLLITPGSTPTFKSIKDNILLVDQVLCNQEYRQAIKDAYEVQKNIPV